MTRTSAERYLLAWLWILILALTAAVIALAVLAPRAQRKLYSPGDKAWIDRAARGAAAQMAGETIESVRGKTFPIVIHLSRQVCVELRPRQRDSEGGYLACYDRSGRVVEEIVFGPTFP